MFSRHLESHARDCRRRDPLKPCNTLPTDRDDLKARQLSDVPPEIKSNSSIAPAAVASNSSITTSEAVSTIPTVTVSTSSETSTPVVSQNAIVCMFFFAVFVQYDMFSVVIKFNNYPVCKHNRPLRGRYNTFCFTMILLGCIEYQHCYTRK